MWTCNAPMTRTVKIKAKMKVMPEITVATIVTATVKVHGNLAAFAIAKSIVRTLADSVYDDMEDSDRDPTARPSDTRKTAGGTTGVPSNASEMMACEVL
jgi:hypothetical protein